MTRFASIGARAACVSLFLALATRTFAADEPEYVFGGLRELSLHGAYTMADDSFDDAKSAAADLRFGYFINEWAEIGLSAAVEYVDYDRESNRYPRIDVDRTSFLLGPFFALNFSVNQLVLYPFVSAGYAHGNEDSSVDHDNRTFDKQDDAGYVQGGAGLRVFLDYWVAFDLRADYTTIYWRDAFGDTEDRFSVAIGFSFFF